MSVECMCGVHLMYSEGETMAIELKAQGEWVDKMPTCEEWEAEQTQCAPRPGSHWECSPRVRGRTGGCSPGRVKTWYFRCWMRVYWVRRWFGKRLVIWGCSLAGADVDGLGWLEGWDDRWD